jgi:PKD repeat protein
MFAQLTQPTKVNLCFHEPEELADFLHAERTRLASQAHFCRLCLICHRSPTPLAMMFRSWFPRKRSITKRYRTRHLVIETLSPRLAMTVEGQTFALDQSVDISELMGEVSGTVQWGDGTSTPATVASKPTAGPLRARIDYSLDTSGFFQTNERRVLLQSVLDSILSRFNDTLATIQPVSGDLWEAKFKNPSTGTDTSRSNLTIAANEVVVFVGARTLGVENAVGSRGGFSVSSSRQSFVDSVKGRGQAGALANPQTDVGPWGGAIAFDVAENWYFGSSLSGINSSQVDFVSVAAHEFLHVLGFGTTASFDNKIVNSKFTGSSATQEYGAAIPMADADHFGNAITYQGRRPLMVPSINNGERLLPTRLDLAAMDDIGWDLISPVARITGNKVFGDNGTYPASIALQGSIGTKAFPVSISITNVAPTFEPRGNAIGTEGVPLNLSRIGRFSDPGFGSPFSTPPRSETFTYRIQWGDGSSDNGSATVESIGNGINPTRGYFDGAHTYTSPGIYTVTLTVTDDDGGSSQQQFQVTVAPSPALTLAIDKSTFSEAGGAGVAVLTISRPASLSGTEVLVQLASSDNSEATLPPTAILAAGVTSTTVGVTAVDDALFDGSQTVEFSASAPNFQNGRISVIVTDYQPIALVPENTQLNEDDPTLQSTRVTISIRSPAPVGGARIALSAMPNGVLNFPASVVIPAGLQQMDFIVATIDDVRPQRLRNVRLDATGTNLISQSTVFSVTDSDPFRWTNPTRVMDVNNDESIDPLDVLVIINEINRSGSRALDPAIDIAPPFYDTNPDGFLDPLDVLGVINTINAR